jgi:hypothetical protein
LERAFADQVVRWYFVGKAVLNIHG